MEAYSYHQMALAAAEKPISGDIQFRAHLGMGLAQLWKGLCLHKEQAGERQPTLNEATDHLYWVLDEYEKNPLWQRMLPAALAFHGLGVAFLNSSVRIQMNDFSDPETATTEIDHALGFLEQAKSITERLNSQEAYRLGEQVQDLLGKAQCLKTSSKAEALSSCGIDFEGAMN